MAIAVDASSPSVVNAAAAKAVTTASFTPPVGSVLVAMAVHDTTGTTGSTIATTDSQSLTWTTHATRTCAEGPSGQGCQVQLSTAVVTTSTAMTVTSTQSGTGSDNGCALRVAVITGANTASPVEALTEFSASSSAISQAITTVTDGALGWIVAGDWYAAASPTAGSGCTTDAGVVVTGQVTLWSGRRSAATSPAGSVTISSSAPTSGTWYSGIAYAVTPQTSSEPPRLPVLSAPSAAVVRASTW